MTTLHDFKIETLNGEQLALSNLKGKPVLLVNVASECGFTPQYADLQKLYEDFGNRGLVVLGVPCNDFGAQEPGTEAEIGAFCEKNYGVSFPMTAKQQIVGADRHPLYQWIADELGDEHLPKWNFHKYLFDGEGRLAGAWPSKVKPLDRDILDVVDKLL